MTETAKIAYQIKTASEEEIRFHLKESDASFIPALSTRVDLDAYSKKIFDRAVTFEAWSDAKLVGLIAAYFNETSLIAFITSVSVLNGHKGSGIAANLLQNCKDYATQHRYKELVLEVFKDNIPATGFYTKHGFQQTDKKEEVLTMNYQL